MGLVISIQMRQYIALDDFKAQQKGDLGFKAGEILTIVATREDGWWEAENSKGKRGVVPITYLQVNKYYCYYMIYYCYVYVTTTTSTILPPVVLVLLLNYYYRYYYY